MLLLVSLGGGATSAAASTSPAEYAKAYCRSVQTFRLQIAKDEAQFHTATASDGSGLVTAKQQIVSFLTAQSKAARAAASAMGNVEAPAAKKGDQLAQGVVDALNAFRDELGVLADNAARLSTTDAKAFAKAAAGLDAGGFRRSLRRLDRKLTALGTNRPIGKALAAQKACAALF